MKPSDRIQQIGVIVPELRHPFFAEILDGIEVIAFEKGYSLLVSQSREDQAREAQVVHHFLSRKIDGLLVSISQYTRDEKHFQSVIDQKIPLVFFDRACTTLPCSRVVVDDFEGAFKATEHLILSGYNPISHLAGPETLQIAKNRFEGYRAALKKYDFPVSKDMVVACGMDEQSGIKGTRQLLKRKKRPEAIFAVNDPVAVGALKEIKNAGLDFPDDIALVGFSDNPMAAVLEPPLTTVAQPRFEIGKRAAEMLIDQIENSQENLVPVEVVLKTKLIIRQSS